MDKVSVIIPVYNVNTDYFDICIESLVKQTYDNYEIIIVDDGSNDLVAKKCDFYSQKYDMVNVYHKKNEGVSVARNFGMRKAKGKWIMFVDSDDWIEPETCQKLADGISKNRNVDIVINIIIRDFILSVFAYFLMAIYTITHTMLLNIKSASSLFSILIDNIFIKKTIIITLITLVFIIFAFF